MFALILIVLVGSVLVGWLLPLVFKSERPYGLAGDILVPPIVGVLYAFVVYRYLVPMVGLTGWFAFVGSALESIAVAAVTLWIMRKIKK
ncbi:MAG: hypothetical protein JSV68_14750 [Anaerolineaceae bacterium]|jgi:uncharacterized membrane protein YeaQ/YmgE (transglycosylase-associated protein family)|nr:hypothetical protein [Chloroflexota bacterium]UCC50358.1 MAG: hypothetical protein JSV68_14750 [Anaerolineaceae bacterium]